MARLLDRLKVPHGGYWFYVDSETRRPFASPRSWSSLVGSVLDFYHGCSREVPPDLEDQIDRHMAGRQPAGFIVGEPEPQPSYFDVSSASSRYCAGAASCPAIDAEHRATVCKDCPLNDFGLGLQYLDLRATLRSLRGGQTVTSDGWLGLCRHFNSPCGDLVFTSKPISGPAGCWAGSPT